MSVYDLYFREFTEYVKQIKYGYIDSAGNKHIDFFTNPTDDYLLQNPKQLIKSNIGLCFDIVELYRSYFQSKGITTESYYFEYCDENILECHTCIIEKRNNNMWYECIDNSWSNNIIPRGYREKEMLIKSIYDWFQSYVEKQYSNINKCNYYMNKYPYPDKVFNHELSLRAFCTNRKYLKSHRIEYSGMAIVFCQQKVLVLETKHNEFVFPKGHIEQGEDSKDASIRECLEESGISIANGNYYGQCGTYSYTFSAGHLKISNDDFYKTFEINSITKNIYVHVYEIDNFQSFTLESIFIKGIWIDIDKITSTITHENTRSIFLKSLDLYKMHHNDSNL